MSKTRTETDSFGPIEVDATRYWGAQAQRSIGNFKIGWEKQPLPVVRALSLAFLIASLWVEKTALARDFPDVRTLHLLPDGTTCWPLLDITAVP